LRYTGECTDVCACIFIYVGCFVLFYLFIFRSLLPLPPHTCLSSASSFLTISADGSLSSWGGYITTRCEDPSLCVPMPANIHNVKAVISNSASWALLLDDETVVCFGYSSEGGRAPASGLTNIRKVYGNGYAFVAITNDNNALAWGHPDKGGTLPARLASGGAVRDVYSAESAFAASKFLWANMLCVCV